jgi:hypothetical protein
MKNLIESIRQRYQPQSEATMMKDDGKMVHNCAKHVEHAEWGKGNTIAEEHADPDRYGNIAWYDIIFEHGIEKGVPINELTVLQAENHMHATKKAKKVAEAAPAGSSGAVDTDSKQSIKKSAMDAAMAAANKTATGPGEKDTIKKQGVSEKVEVDEATKKKPYDKEEVAKKIGAAMDKAHDAVQKGRAERQAAQAIANAKYGKMKKEEVEQLEEVEIDVDETIIHKDLEYSISEADKNYDKYFKAKLKTSGKNIGSMSDDEKKKFFNDVDNGFKAKNEEIFIEAFMHSDLEDIKNAHKKAGNKISNETSGTRDGKPHHSFVVTTPEGKRTRHIYHGSTKKLETMSPAAKSKESTEQDLDDK